MSELHVSLIQTSLHWENPEANLAMFTKKLDQISPATDVVVLPEMFTTGFSMSPENLAEPENGRTLQWMKEMAQKHDIALTGSVIIQEGKHYFNRLFWVYPDGMYHAYDKRHLFSLAGEEKKYRPGENRLVVQYKGFTFLPLICYDLRFPVWSRNDLGYDVLLYVANWPERRAYYWNQLLIARAIENQSYVIGVNRVGDDGNGIFHSGDSQCLDPLGQTVGRAESGKEEILEVVLSRKTIHEVRETFRFLDDRDEFHVVI
jgi:predicted amidohydrolase